MLFVLPFLLPCKEINWSYRLYCHMQMLSALNGSLAQTQLKEDSVLDSRPLADSHIVVPALNHPVENPPQEEESFQAIKDHNAHITGFKLPLNNLLQNPIKETPKQRSFVEAAKRGMDHPLASNTAKTSRSVLTSETLSSQQNHASPACKILGFPSPTMEQDSGVSCQTKFDERKSKDLGKPLSSLTRSFEALQASLPSHRSTDKEGNL